MGSVGAAGNGDARLRVLPPSPNWYCSQICDWGWSAEDGALVAFGAKNDVYVYKVLSASDTAGNAAGSSSSLAFLAQVPRGRKAQRVTALRFLHVGVDGGALGAAGRPRVVCGSEAGHVQIWDVGSREVLEQHRKHAAEVTAVATASRGAMNSSVVVAGDRQGFISCWVRDSGRVSVFAPVSGDGVFCMAMSPRDAALVAVGFRSGLLCLVDASQGSVLHRVDAHDQELQSLSWHPTQERAGWLASSSRDKSIKIWRVCGEDAEETERLADAAADGARRTAATLAMDRVLRLPTGKQGQAYNPSKHLWLPVAWSTATVDRDAADQATTSSKPTMRLWSGSFDGNLLMWDVPVSEASTGNEIRSSGSPPLKPVAVKNGHNRILFNIVALPSDVSVLRRQFPSLLTVSLDRELRLWNETRAIKAGSTASAAPALARTVSRLLGLGGHVYCAAYNDRASTLALACGDQTIRLWKLHGGKGGLYETELLWKGLKSKVTSVAWHPLTPGVLAFGTEDGTLGIYDTQSKKQTRFRSNHAGEVQQLEWRLDSGDSASNDGGAETDSRADAFLDAMHKLERAQAQGADLDDALTELESTKRRPPQAESPALRVVLWSRDASGQLLESDAERPDTPSHVVSAVRSCSAFAWSEDDDTTGTLAVGNPNGSVKLVDPTLLRRPARDGLDTAATDSDTIIHDHNERVGALAWSTRGGVKLLATGCDDGKIFVYRFGSDAPTLMAQLAGHSGKVTRLRWQPPPPDTEGKHSESGALPLLASCAADGSARVWDVLDRERQPVARFYGHVGRVLALEWVSCSVLVTGGEDQTARMWDLRCFPADAEAESDVGELKAYKVPSSQRVVETVKTDADAVKEVSRRAVHASLLTPSSAPVKQKKKKAKAKSTPLFHAEAASTPLDEVARLLAQRTSPSLDGVNGTSARPESSGAFTSALLQLGNDPTAADPRRAMATFAMSEQARFASEGDWEAKARVLLLGGQIADALRVVAEQGALNATWLSLAPMAGLDVWRETSALFARQLEAQGDHAQAAVHWLGIGKVRAAVRTLVTGSAFREALALIRLRLGLSDPLVEETTWRYAEWLEARGDYGDAALAFLSLEHVRGAVSAPGASDSTSWRWRAVRALVKTRSVACIAQAVELLHEAASSAATEPPLAFPATFLTVDVIGALVRGGEFSIAERAADLLLLSSPTIRAHSSLPMATTGFRLTRCLLGVLSALERHRLSGDGALAAEQKTLADWHRQYPNNEAPQLLLALVDCGRGDSAAYPSSLVSASPETLPVRADAFWSDVLGVCHLCGVWAVDEDADGGGSTLEEAQELLMDDEQSWLLLEWRNAMDASDVLSSSALRVDAAIDLLRLAVDAMLRCLVSAMEHVTRLLEDIVDLSNEREKEDVDVMSFVMQLLTLVFPAGIASSSSSSTSLLEVGELAEELADARTRAVLEEATGDGPDDEDKLALRQELDALETTAPST